MYSHRQSMPAPNGKSQYNYAASLGHQRCSGQWRSAWKPKTDTAESATKGNLSPSETGLRVWRLASQVLPSPTTAAASILPLQGCEALLLVTSDTTNILSSVCCLSLHWSGSKAGPCLLPSVSDPAHLPLPHDWTSSIPQSNIP